MVICALGRYLLRNSRCSRSWCRQSSLYSASHGFRPEEIQEKLSAFPGGSVDLLTQEESGLAVLTINNPSRMNAFSGGMMVQLEQRVAQLETWTQGKGLIVRGASGTFCSGSDLNAVRAISSPEDGKKMCMFMQDTLTRLWRLPLVSVALVEGRALGGGAELTTACDFRLVAPGSVIQFVHKRMGLVPGWGGATRLVHLVGGRHALRLLGGALKVEPAVGLRMGLADGLLEEEEGGDGGALRQAEAWLAGYTQGPAEVVRAAKRVVVAGRELPLTEALREEMEVFGTVWGGPANLRALAGNTKHK